MIFDLTANSNGRKLPELDANYPEDQSVSYAGGYPSVTLEVRIAKDGRPKRYSYQWYKNGIAISGATGSTYSYTPSAGSETVYCEVTNTAGTVASRTATITGEPLYLMNGGNTCYSVTGGWPTKALVQNSSATSSGAPTVTANDSDITILSAQKAYAAGIAYTANKIDLTDFNTLTFNGSVNGSGCVICVWSGIGSTWEANRVAYASVADGASIDVSGLTGSYYIGFGVATGSDSTSTRRTITVNSLFLS